MKQALSRFVEEGLLFCQTIEKVFAFSQLHILYLVLCIRAP